MVFDLLWTAGVALSIAGLLYGAYLVLVETEPLLSWFGKKPAVPLPLSVRDLLIIENVARSCPAIHPPTGVAVLDTEHQHLFGELNRLQATIRSGQPVDKVGATIDALIRDVVWHFQDEEEILAAAGYARTAEHAALHRELVNGAIALAERFRSGMSDIGEFFRFLARNIIARHMLDADREFTSYLKNQH